MMKETLFTKIAKGKIKSHIWHQNQKYMAFLTPFPNTKGVTVVAPKEYMPSYVFSLDEDSYLDFMRYVKLVAAILDRKMKNWSHCVHC